MFDAAILFIVSAPSGAGKTSLLSELVPSDERLLVSISHTTRAMRPGEEDGVHYHFVSVEHFQHLAAEGAFLEHAKVFDHYYGTTEAGVRGQLAGGHDLVLEIDWQGADQVRQRFADAVSIFVAPPSIRTLRERLSQRGQDNVEVVERRMAEARRELSHYPEYDYLVINDNFSLALEDLRAILRAERLRAPRQALRAQAVLEESLGPMHGKPYT